MVAKEWPSLSRTINQRKKDQDTQEGRLFQGEKKSTRQPPMKSLLPRSPPSECPVKSRVALLARSDPAAAPPSLQYFRGGVGAQRITSIAKSEKCKLFFIDQRVKKGKRNQAEGRPSSSTHFRILFPERRLWICLTLL